MFSDYTNFFILYTILVFMFTIIGNLNFILDQSQFTTFFESILFVLDASIGTDSKLQPVTRGMRSKVNDTRHACVVASRGR